MTVAESERKKRERILYYRYTASGSKTNAKEHSQDTLDSKIFLHDNLTAECCEKALAASLTSDAVHLKKKEKIREIGEKDNHFLCILSLGGNHHQCWYLYNEKMSVRFHLQRNDFN